MQKKRKKEVRAGCCAGRAAPNTRRAGRRTALLLLAAAGWAGFGPVRSAADPLFFFFYSFSNLTENCLLFCLQI
jgi:hypothetical protein